MYKRTPFVWLVAAALCLTSHLAAQESKDQKEGEENSGDEKAAPEEIVAETSHQITIDGQVVAYTATAGTLVLKEEDGTAKASVFFIAYTRDGEKDPSRRPLTFSFNGGPGSSSVWLHLGTLGPRRVLMDDEGWPLPPPYRLVDNDQSILDVTDLVFIDPVTTGYSRPAPEEDPSQFHGIEEDLEWVAEFIRLYTTRFERWASPKFLIGESYGTTRAAGLAGHLQQRHGMYLNGIMLVSSILNFQTARFDVGNDLPYILFLPTYTATAWYHQQLDSDLQQDLRATLDEVEEFARGEYTEALMLGDDLDPEAEDRIVQKVARYTGLSPEYVRQTNMRILIHRFVKELMRDERRTVGRLDSRFTGSDRNAARELEFESDLPYEILTGRVRPWSYDEYQNRYVNVAETLRQAMTRNPSLKVFVANGYYDLATPYFATEYTFKHLGLDPELRDQVSMGYYESGHMMYIHKPSLIRLKSDLAEFIRSAQ